MKKITFILLFLIITNSIFSQDISSPKPILTYNNNQSNLWVALGDNMEIGCGNTSFQIKASWTDIGSPDQYRVEAIPYRPKPYARDRNFDGQITNVDFVGQPGALLSNLTDDSWSSELQLTSGGTPFDFCYFGNQRNFFRITANGAISFNTAGNYPTPPAYSLYGTGDYASWTIQNMGKINPSANMDPYRESILSPFHSISPTHSSALADTYSFWNILGTVNERYFILGTHHVPMYSCGNSTGYATHQMVFYETTNIIEFHIQDKPICDTWTGGYAALGIQNKDLDTGYSAPGRDNLEHWQVLDLTDGFYDSNTNSNYPVNPSESWRFIPDGPNGTAPVFTWYSDYNHTTQTGTPYGSNPNDAILNIAVADFIAANITSITFTAEVAYTDYCTGAVSKSTKDVTFVLSDSLLMHIKELNSTDDTIEFQNIEDLILCEGDNYSLEALTQNYDSTDGSSLTYQWQVEQSATTTQLGTNTIEGITNAQIGAYVYTVAITHTDSTGSVICMFDDSINVIVNDCSTANVNNNVLDVFNIFPNPVKDRLKLNFQEKHEKISTSIYTIYGKLVYKNDYSQSNTITINVSDLNSGVYFISTLVENKISTKKFIKF